MTGLDRLNRPLLTRSLVAAGIVLAFASAATLRAQTAPTPTPTAKPSAKVLPKAAPHKMKLKARDYTPGATLSPDDAPASLTPNYAKVASTLRRWRQPEILVHVTPSDNDRRTPEQITALVTQGLALWTDKIPNKPVFHMAAKDDTPDLEISFVPAGSLSGGRIGVTDVQFTVPEGDILHADIHLVEGLSSAQLVQAVAHESGHALGIQGHSEDKHDLMYPYAHLPAALSAADQNTLAFAYYNVDTSKKREYKRGQKTATARSF